MTTFRKLPTHSPTTAASTRRATLSNANAKGIGQGRARQAGVIVGGGSDTMRAACCRPRTVAVRRWPHPAERHDCASLPASPSDDGAKLEYRQVHRDDESADHDAQEN